jgi:6-dehydroglucose reductase
MHDGPTRDTRIPLGSSGIEVAPLGWGMWRFAGADLHSARRRIDAALEIGCTLFDTADIYGLGTADGFGGAEALLGQVLRADRSLRDQMVLATKGGITPPVPYDSSAKYLIEACEASLKRLGVDCVDLWQIHRPDLLAHPAEIAAALDRLRAAGKIRAAGVSNYTAAQVDALAAHLPFELASIQPEFSALAIEPLSDGVLDLALRRRLAVLAWSPLGQGRLGGAAGQSTADGRADAVAAALDVVAARAGVTRTAVAYAWVMAHPTRAIPLIGSQNPARIREAAQAYAVHLSRAEWYRILEASRGARMP